MQQTTRPWLSLWVTVHFVIIALSLITNGGSSELLRRMARVVAPYAVALHQDYGGVALEMTGGQELDRPCQIQVQYVNQSDDQWHTIAIGAGTLLDDRGFNFQRMVSIVAQDKNEELIHLLFDQAIEQLSDQPQAVERVRLQRPANPSYQEFQLMASGQLPPGSVIGETVIECRVVSLAGGARRLVPVIEKVRTAPGTEAQP